MDVVVTLDELRGKRSQLIPPVGLVPTMGFLHAGHISLVERARAECTSVVVSIFINPTQFGAHEDLNKYPRNLERDLEMLREARTDLVWVPTEMVMYPVGFQTWVMVEELTKPLEGAKRPGHFRGVTTVVAKLFNAVQPQRAYFGQKDAQQATVIRQMAYDLDFPIEIVVCPIVREPDGLAMSSRNVYLSPEERRQSMAISRGLFQAESAFTGGVRDAQALKKIVLDILASEPNLKVQYVSCADPVTLEELDGEIRDGIISLAVMVGKTRLIDNILLEEGK